MGRAESRLRLKQTCFSAGSARMLNTKKQADSKEQEDPSKPLKFSTSKGSHHTWTVEKSFGSEYQRPWWKVLPVSLFITAVLLWAVFREETEMDKIIYRPISELLNEIEKKKAGGEKGK